MKDVIGTNDDVKARTKAGAIFAWKYAFLLAAAAALIIFLVVQIQRYFDRRAIEKQTEQIEEFDAQTKAAREQTEKLMDVFNRQHESTLSILDTVKAMDGAINKLSENDARQDGAVNNLREEYNNAKNANNPKTITKTKTNTVYLPAKPNRNLRQRENDILAADADLYNPVSN